MDSFVSVGTGLNPQQEVFVAAVEDRLRAAGLNPCTIGRNTFSADAPLHAVTALMDRCAGAVVIALERYEIEAGTERRGSLKQQSLSSIFLPTPWNQIEAAMAYGRGLPILVLVDERLRREGLLEKGNDWYVHELPLDPNALNSPPFIGLMGNWRDRLTTARQAGTRAADAAIDPTTMSMAQLVGALKPAQLWAALVAVAAVVGGAFALGVKLAG